MTLSYKFYLLLFIPIILTAFLGHIVNLTIPTAIFDVIIFCVLIYDYVNTNYHKDLRITRICPKELSYRNKNTVEISVQNTNKDNIQILIKDNYPDNMISDMITKAITIPANTTAFFTYSIIPKLRTKYQFKGISYRYKTKLGLSYKSQTIKDNFEVSALHNKKQLDQLMVKITKSSALGEIKQNLIGISTNFNSLKEYTHGDTKKNIDWKATARKDKPIVKSFIRENQQNLVILVDSGRLMQSQIGDTTKFDESLETAFSLALTGLSQNDYVGFGIFNDTPQLFIKPRRDLIQLNKIISACVDYRATNKESNYITSFDYFNRIIKERSLFVIFTDVSDELSCQNLCQGISLLNKKHLTFIATIRDSKVFELINTPADFYRNNKDSLFKIYQRTIASILLNDRNEALSSLRRIKTLTLDTSIENFNQTVINNYLNIKMQEKL